MVGLTSLKKIIKIFLSKGLASLKKKIINLHFLAADCSAKNACFFTCSLTALSIVTVTQLNASIKRKKQLLGIEHRKMGLSGVDRS